MFLSLATITGRRNVRGKITEDWGDSNIPTDYVKRQCGRIGGQRRLAWCAIAISSYRFHMTRLFCLFVETKILVSWSLYLGFYYDNWQNGVYGEVGGISAYDEKHTDFSFRR